MANIQINSVVQRIQHASVGAGLVNFNIPFPFLANADITAYKDSTLLVLTTDYTLTGAGNAGGGTLTLNVATSGGENITILGDLTIDRTSIYNSALNALTGTDLNSDFNRDILMISQRYMREGYLMLQYQPYAEVSQDITVTTDRWLPILPASNCWKKNAGDTAIEAFELPDIAVGIKSNIVTDNVLVKTDLPSGNYIQETGITISDADAMTGVTLLTVDTITIDGTQITASGNLDLDPGGNLQLNPGGDLKLYNTVWPTSAPAAGNVLGASSPTTLVWTTAANFAVAPGADNRVIRADGTGGGLQDSLVVIDDLGAMSGVTQLDVDNVQIDGNAITVTNADADLTITANGTGNVLFNGSNVICGDPGTEGAGITVGGATYNAELKVSDLGGTNVAQFIIHRHSTTLAPMVVGARSNSNDSSHSIVTDGQPVLALYGCGWDSADYAIAGTIEIEVDGTPGAGDMPGRIVFSVSPDGSETPAEAMRISQDKSVAIAGATTTVTINIGSTVTIDGTIDDDTMATASDTTLATSESIKAYIDNRVGSGGVGSTLALLLGGM